MTTRMRVVTYNVLSSSLCDPSWFVKCAPRDLNPATRLDRVKSQLKPHLDNKAIVGLQEVSREWVGPLHAWFSRHGYQLATSLYGHRGNGYMGVALAWPSSIQLESMHVVRPADRLPAPPRVDDGFFRRIWNHFVSPRPFDTWHEALRKQNTLVVASFEDFCVAVYHMPCLFGSIPKEQVMVIHATLAANAARDLAGGKPYVLAGDFNIKPFDQAYALLTSGSIQNDEYLPPPYADFEPTIQEPLVSAYKACLGAEPDFTNFAFTKYNKDCFIETLDYIFCSPHWHVQDVKRLKSKAHVDLDKPYPDQHEPSDHVLLAADLALKKS